MDKLTIGKMAKLNGVSPQTLRLYDRIKLLEPCETNPETGYRYYHIKQCAQLDMIQYMKALGMNLAQIKECFENQDIKQFEEVLRLQKQNIRKQIETLKHAEKSIDRAIEGYRRYQVAPREEIPVLEYQKDRRIFCYDTKINAYSYGMEYYEQVLRALKKNYALHRFPMSYFCNVGSIIRHEHFMKRELMATEVFVFIDGEFESSEGVEVIPEGMYVCLYCDGFNREEQGLVKLMDYIFDHGYKVVGDCISEILVELPTKSNYDRKAFFKLQVMIKK
ncbi:MAG: MerR family transcriptional regulator [Anaerovoracaceae bacterium]|jgi:DNA-binding transcriptional MerR regulator